MTTKNKADVLIREHQQAKERIEKIGAPEPHFRPTTFGRLTTLSVKTTIGHQARPSDTNYWEDERFDVALAAVIRSDFSALASKALDHMKREAEAALIDEEEELRERLAAIEAIKAAGEQT